MIWDCFSRSLLFFFSVFCIQGRLKAQVGEEGFQVLRFLKYRSPTPSTELPRHDRNRIWCKKQANRLVGDIIPVVPPISPRVLGFLCSPPLSNTPLLFLCFSPSQLSNLPVSLKLDCFPKKVE